MQLGYSENWINQRLKSIEVRKELTDEWSDRGLKEGIQFATLTDIIYKAWAGKSSKEYKVFKRVKKRKPERQHDQYRIDFKYVGRSFYQRYILSHQSSNIY